MPETPAFNRLKQCRHGLLLYNINDQYIGRSLDIYGEFSHGEVDLFQQFVRPGDVVVDVGANIGAHTLYLAQTVGPNGAVLAFEPQRIIYQTLCANMALNNIINTQCLQLGLGEQAGVMQTAPVNYAAANNFGGLPLGIYPNGEPVHIVRLDAYVVPSCKLVKVDVEGMELEVLKGAVGLIARHRPFLYVENDRKEKSDALIRYINSIGYKMYWHAPPLFNPNNFFGNTENVFGNIVSLNLFCVHASQPHNIKGLQQVEVPA